MKRKLVTLAPYLILLGIDFYLFPLLARDTGSAMLVMLCAMPLAAFTAAVICGARSGFTAVLPIAALLLFIPTIWIHYNATAWVYAPVYGAVVLAGVCLGRLFHRKA
ncbi:MAG: hypothetical protein HFF65_05975 [Oscillospiraceae bacterium]|jgi:hypothetical protein|nr:hypothetical protein [Oscillospiraceae bacterium]